jgi:hypothetical protein
MKPRVTGSEGRRVSRKNSLEGYTCKKELFLFLLTPHLHYRNLTVEKNV